MPAITPQQITKAVLKEAVDGNKGVDWSANRMIELWREAFQMIKYADDVDFMKHKKKSEGPVKRRPTDDLGLGFDEVWGSDLTDVSAFIGTAVSSKSGNDAPAFQTVELNVHINEGLTKTQLEKTGFVELGGLVVTFLNPMLKSASVKVRKGSHVICRAQRYEVAEIVEMVNWPEYKGPLYCVANCLYS